MSKRKDRERAEAGHPHVSSPTLPQYMCPFPGCGRTFRKENNQPDACMYHRQLISDYAFCVAHVSVEVKPRAGGLVIPRSQAQADEIISKLNVLTKKG